MGDGEPGCVGEWGTGSHCDFSTAGCCGAEHSGLLGWAGRRETGDDVVKGVKTSCTGNGTCTG
jgi:hypothetical protein